MSFMKDAVTKNIGTDALTLSLVLSLGLNVYLARHTVRGQVSFPALKAGASVPAYILLQDADGKPVNGVYIKSNQTEVENYFGLELPGLPETHKSIIHDD